MRKFLSWLLVIFLTILAFPVAAQNPARLPNNPNARVAVTVSGVNDELATNIRQYLRIYELDGELAPATFRLRFLLNRGEQQIRDALAPYGYYRPTVVSSMQLEGDIWQIHYDIDVGEQVRIGQLDIQILGDAHDDEAFTQLLAQQPLTVNSIFSHSDYESLKSQLRSLAAERGYHDAQFVQQRVNIELSDLSAAVILHFQSGTRYRFGKISFCCNALEESLLQRFPAFAQGDFFNTRQLLDLQVALAGSDYFSSIEIAPRWEELDSDTQQVPIDVALAPNNRDRYQIGLGFGTDTGARATLGFDRRWLNPQGHQLKSLLRLSQLQNTGLISYNIPGKNPAKDLYSFTAEVNERNYNEQNTTLYRLTARDIRHYNKWQRTWQIGWQREDFSFGDEPTRSSNFLVPSAEFSFIESKSAQQNRNLIDDGYRLSIHVQGASDSVYAETSFISARVSAKWVHQLSEQWRVLLRGEVGGMQVDDFEKLSPSLRFFAGGDHSVRGYGYQQLGNTNAEGIVIGGQYLATGSVEFDYLWRDNWRFAVFSDFGNTSQSWPITLKQTVGVGVRWLSPIGPIRIDVANAIDEPDKPWRLHLTIGPDL